MSDDDRIDFSALDPAHDGRRWDALMQRTIDGALDTQPEPWVLTGRWRVALAGLAAIALLSWVPAWLGGEAQPAAATSHDATLAMLQYAQGGDVTALLESADGY